MTGRDSMVYFISCLRLFFMIRITKCVRHDKTTPEKCRRALSNYNVCSTFLCNHSWKWFVFVPDFYLFSPFTLIERTCSLYHSAFNHSSAINKIFSVDSFQLMKFLRSIFCDRRTTCRNQLLGAESSLQGSILIKPVMNISQ